MKFSKPKFWDIRISFFAILLMPLTIVFILITILRKIITKSKKFNIPIICVGNIYLGGTGKTPVAIFLAKELSEVGKKPSIVRKFYENHRDEYSLINNSFKFLITAKNRVEGLNKAEMSGSDIAILDDGLQDHTIEKNLNIVCFNSSQLIGNGLILPSGPLRESLSILKNTEIVIINGNKVENFENKLLNINKNLEILYSSYEPINLEKFKNKKLLALAGIGNPENFFQLMENNNLKIHKKLIFPDHYRFTKDEMKNIIKEAKEKNYQIIMTEKDYFKVHKYNLQEIDYLKIKLNIHEKEKLLKKINSIYD